MMDDTTSGTGNDDGVLTGFINLIQHYNDMEEIYDENVGDTPRDTTPRKTTKRDKQHKNYSNTTIKKHREIIRKTRRHTQQGRSRR